MGILIITHHDKLLEHNAPDFTHVMLGGRIVETGGVELADELHTQGYDRIRAAYPDAAADERRDGRRRSSRLRRRLSTIADASTNHTLRIHEQKASNHGYRHSSTSSDDAIGEINKYDFRTDVASTSSRPARGSIAEIVARSRR